MEKNTKASICKKCGRLETPEKIDYCPECGEKAYQCSRYEWFLQDSLSSALRASRRVFRIEPQYIIRDHRGFEWIWDLYVYVKGSSSFGGINMVIDIQGPNHKKQKIYSGPGGGYTRDDDKEWEIRKKAGNWEWRYFENDECQKRIVTITAGELADELCDLADTYI